jgi:hypothetical protein
LAFYSGREADHSPPSGAEVKEWVELYLHSPVRLHSVVLSYGEHRDNFTFVFTFTLKSSILTTEIEVPTLKCTSLSVSYKPY